MKNATIHEKLALLATDPKDSRFYTLYQNNAIPFLTLLTGDTQAVSIECLLNRCWDFIYIRMFHSVNRTFKLSFEQGIRFKVSSHDKYRSWQFGLP